MSSLLSEAFNALFEDEEMKGLGFTKPKNDEEAENMLEKLKNDFFKGLDKKDRKKKEKAEKAQKENDEKDQNSEETTVKRKKVSEEVDEPEVKKPVEKKEKKEEKKPVEKKTEEKKPVEKEPVEKKDEEKKPIEKKQVEKKSVEKTQEEKKPVEKKAQEEKSQPENSNKKRSFSETTKTEKNAPKKVVEKIVLTEEERVELIKNNQKITQLSSRKEITQAYALFKSLIESRKFNNHTFGAILNGIVTCNHAHLIDEVLEIMNENNRKPRDVVLCTILMKGYIKNGRLTKAIELFKDITTRSPIVKVNIRTINTLLRGCVYMSHRQHGEEIFNNAQKELKIPLDVSSWESLLMLYGQNLEIDKMLPIIGRLKNEPAMKSGVIPMNLSLIRALLVSGEWKNCKKNLTSLASFLETFEFNDDFVGEEDEDDENNDDETDEKKEKKSVVTGGKKAWKSSTLTEAQEDRRNQSLLLYREHLREEWKEEIEHLKKFIETKSNDIGNHFDYLVSHLSNYFIFNYDSDDEKILNMSNSEQIFHQIASNFGLNSLCKKYCGYTYDELFPEEEKEDESKQSKKKQKNDPNLKKKKSLKINFEDEKVSNIVKFINKLKSFYQNSFNEDGTINFETISKGFDGKGNEDKPIKLEICSGAGEWAVSQAKADPNSTWMSLELRFDRVYQTFLKAYQENASNLLVSGGDGLKIISEKIPNNSISNVFVNHPEPPQQTGGNDSEGHHMLKEDFFLNIQKILKKKEGMLTIVTDNVWYGKFLTRLIAGIKGLNELKSYNNSYQNENWKLFYEVDGVCLWVGEPGNSGGHVVSASSYFDRLWKRGNIEERYFIVLSMGSTPLPTANPTIKVSVGLAPKKARGSLDLSVQTAKKITFDYDD